MHKEYTIRLMEILKGENLTDFDSVTGWTRIVKNPNELCNIKYGDIVVADRIYPDLIMYLNIARAVIVNEGGIGVNIIPLMMEQKFPVVVIENATKILKEDILLTLSSDGVVYWGSVKI